MPWPDEMLDYFVYIVPTGSQYFPSTESEKPDSLISVISSPPELDIRSYSVMDGYPNPLDLDVVFVFLAYDQML
jgi:hypothetical protein